MLWDIGAGAGSIAIEWMLADPSLRAIAVESSSERAARIGRNALALGVPGLTVVEGAAPAALAGLPRPNAIFVGGGGSDDGVLDAAIDALAVRRPAGRQCSDAGDGGDPARPPRQARRRADAHCRVARGTGRLHAWLAAGHAGHAMVVGKTMIVAGIGSRKGVAANGRAGRRSTPRLPRMACRAAQIDRLATAELKRDEPALSDAGAAIGLELTIVDDEALRAASPRTLTHSDLSLALSGAPSVSEAAALAAAGPASRLLGPRLVLGSVTCAIAVDGELP